LVYNFPVIGAVAGIGTRTYFEQLTLLRGKPGTDSGRLEPLAWVAAHVKLFEQYRKTAPQVLAACGWTDKDYYFISLRPPLQQFSVKADRDPLRDERRILGIYRIPLDANGDNQIVTRTSPPTGGRVEEILIP